MFRLLTTEVLWHGIAGACSLVTCSDGRVTLTPFEKETHSTIFVPGPIAILNSLKLDEFVIDDIELMFANSPSPDKKRLDDYFKSSGLYYSSGSAESPVLLKLGRNCQIIPIS